MISHTAASTPNVVADGLELYHGETDAKPRPDPRASKISATAAIAKAPAMIAGHDTAEIALSRVPLCSVTTRPSRTEALELSMIGLALSD